MHALLSYRWNSQQPSRLATNRSSFAARKLDCGLGRCALTARTGLAMLAVAIYGGYSNGGLFFPPNSACWVSPGCKR